MELWEALVLVAVLVWGGYYVGHLHGRKEERAKVWIAQRLAACETDAERAAVLEEERETIQAHPALRARWGTWQLPWLARAAAGAVYLAALLALAAAIPWAAMGTGLAVLVGTAAMLAAALVFYGVLETLERRMARRRLPWDPDAAHLRSATGASTAQPEDPEGPSSGTGP